MCRYFALLVFYSKSIDFNCVIFITAEKKTVFVSISLPRPLSYRNQFIDLLCKSMDWFLYDNGLRQYCYLAGSWINPFCTNLVTCHLFKYFPVFYWSY